MIEELLSVNMSTTDSRVNVTCRRQSLSKENDRDKKLTCEGLQSRTKLLENVFPIMSTFLRNKTISQTTNLRKETPFPLFNVASWIRLSFEHITTLLPGEGGVGRISTATMFRKMLPKYAIFSTVLSKIVAKNNAEENEPVKKAKK